MARACVVIPNYNGEKVLGECLSALRAQTFSDFETIIVDNASQDRSCEIIESEWPDVRLIRLKENTGFAAACNEGVRRSAAPIVVLLNNDAIAKADWLEKLVPPLEEADSLFSVSSLMLKYHSPDIVDDAGDVFLLIGIPSQRGNGAHLTRYSRNKPVTCACGGACAFKRDLYLSLGGLDERFFAYMEDVDLGLRARLMGYRNQYIAGAQVLHIGSATSDAISSDFKVRLSARNRQWLLAKNFSPRQRRWLGPLLAIGERKMRRDYTLQGKADAYLEGYAAGLSLPDGMECAYPHARRGAFLKLLLRMTMDTVPFFVKGIMKRIRRR